MTSQSTRLIAVSLVATFVIAACGGGGGDTSGSSSSATSPAPTTTTSAPPTTTTEATTTSTAGDPWNEITPWSGFQWGAVRTPTFQPAFSFVAPDGWGKGCPETSQSTSFDPPSEVDEYVSASAVRMEFETIEETVAHIAALPVETTEPQPTEIGGAQGVTFDVSGVQEQKDFFEVPDACILFVTPGQKWRFWVVDVAGELVTFSLYAPEETFDAHAESTQSVLDTVVWRDLG